MRVFMLSIKPVGRDAYMHGFHLGTDAKVAREMVEIAWKARNDLESLALVQPTDVPFETRIVDVFDGEWSSARCDALFSD